MGLESKSLVKSNYQIEKQIGGGGSGLTYLVEDNSGEKYCLKEFRFGMRKGDENTFKARDLFEREAKILQSLDHPQIPKFKDYFTEDINGEEKLYLTMEYVPGKSLDQLNLTEQDAIDVAKEMTGVLDYLHSHSPSIIHRDIKPQNIIQTPDNKIKLVDFGSVADKILRDSKISYTRVGTFGYSAPESLYGESRPASDIYSLGATLISLLSGRDPTKMMNSKNRIDFKGKLNVSRQTENLLWDMTDPDWEKRIRSAKELEARLNGRKFGKKFWSLEKRIGDKNELMIPKEKINFVPPVLKEFGKEAYKACKDFIWGFVWVTAIPYNLPTFINQIKDEKRISPMSKIYSGNIDVDALGLGGTTGFFGLCAQPLGYMLILKNGTENLPYILGAVAATNALSYGYEVIKHNLEKRKEAKEKFLAEQEKQKIEEERLDKINNKKYKRILKMLKEVELRDDQKISQRQSLVDNEINSMKRILKN